MKVKEKTIKLKNYVQGKWVKGEGAGTPLFNAVTGEKIAEATSKGLDFNGMLEYARTVGGPALRKMTFHERGRMLKPWRFISLKRKKYFIIYHLPQVPQKPIAG